MRNIVTEELLKKIDNRFMLSIAAAKRARQIKDGAIPLTDGVEGQSELMVALAEIIDDKVSAEIVATEEDTSEFSIINN